MIIVWYNKYTNIIYIIAPYITNNPNESSLAEIEVIKNLHNPVTMFVRS